MARTLRFIPGAVEQANPLGTVIGAFSVEGEAGDLAEALADADAAVVAVSTMDGTADTRTLLCTQLLETTLGKAPGGSMPLRSTVSAARVKITESVTVGGGPSDRAELRSEYVQLLGDGQTYAAPPAAGVVWNSSGALLSASPTENTANLSIDGGIPGSPPTRELIADPELALQIRWLIVAGGNPVTLRVDQIVLEVDVLDPVSIRERIEREFVRRVESVPEIRGVQRWARRNELQHLEAVVLVGEDEPSEGGQSAVGLTQKELDVTVAVNVSPPPPEEGEEAEPVTSAVNRVLAQIAHAILQDPTLTESVAPSQELALDVAEGRGTPPLTDVGQGENIALLDFRVTYRHNRDDPYTGEGITLLVA